MPELLFEIITEIAAFRMVAIINLCIKHENMVFLYAFCRKNYNFEALFNLNNECWI